MGGVIMADDQTGSAAVAAGQGAMAGAALGPWGAAGGAALGIAGSLIGGNMGANAAKKAAEAQQAAAAQWKKYVAQQQSDSLSHVLTPSALAAHDQALSSQEGNVRRQEALVAQLDPNIIEAGKQTMQLLQGKSAPVMQNLQNQRQLQRDQLVSQLRTQLGPGAETSTAGQQQLNQFDQQTANVMSGAQQEYLDKVSNMSMGGAATLGQTLSQVDSTLNSINENGPEQKAAELISQFTSAGAGAAAAGVNAAGGQFKGEQLKGQGIQQLGSGVMSLAGAFAGSGANGKASNPQGGTPQTSGGVLGATDANAQFTMPTIGGQFGGTPPSPGLGTLGSSFAGQSVARSVPAPGGSGGPSAPSYLPFSTGYGGARDAAHDQAYNMSPRSSPYQPFMLNTNGTSYAGGQ